MILIRLILDTKQRFDGFNDFIDLNNYDYLETGLRKNFKINLCSDNNLSLQIERNCLIKKDRMTKT